MNSEERSNALKVWDQLYDEPEIRMDAAEQYEQLVKLAGVYQLLGLISVEEKNGMIIKATDLYASCVVGAEQGT
ncbi:hypothetical protein N5D52_24985 [Pseudomonas sp. GD03860]|uniref:hypothetical protein n=1 Tax=Pseudomonas sp. GD03860 TaxID=2975389 RepID=UPI00244D2AF4|nr:hypothetical protein [Pseudomonas sp. GD03860]MDH0640188.1 hypothetical protein [Pseudomonas sp. GD03860]